MIRREVLSRLLLAKALLDTIRFDVSADPDNTTLGRMIITAHDAAELVIAALADHLGAQPAKDRHYLMDYFEPIKTKMHPEKDMFAKGYFSQLNRVRVDVKHLGIYPNPKDWARAGETVYGYLNKWCLDYVGVSLDGVDLSGLIKNEAVRRHYNNARALVEEREYKEALEELARGLHLLFSDNAAVRGMRVGPMTPESAIRLTGFGVHANDLLALQSFLPNVEKESDGTLSVSWPKSTGHPGNWRENAARFSLSSFVDVALKIQDAAWIPGSLNVNTVYPMFKVTALHDGVELYCEIGESSPTGPLSLNSLLQLTPLRREIMRTLHAGESIVCSVLERRARPPSALFGGQGPVEALDLRDDKWQSIGIVALRDVKVTRIPAEYWDELLPGLPEIEWTFD